MSKYLLSVFLLLSMSSLADTLYVPAEYPTLVSAMDNASPADYILLDSGVYSGDGFKNVILDGDEFFLIIGQYGAEKTVIDLEGDFFMNGYPPVFNWESPLIYLNGIKFINGSYVIQAGYADTYSIQCIFENNDVVYRDTILGGFGVIDSCKFISNDTGIYLHDESYEYIQRNYFYDNTYAIWCDLALNPVIEGNIFYKNIVAILFLNMNNYVHVENNVIVGNLSGINDASDDQWPQDIRCNNVYGNNFNYYNYPDQTGINGNISEEPYFCDTTFQAFSVGSMSPLLPENNSCGVNIGNIELGCYCGDVNASGDIGISDITYFVEYMFNNGSPPIPLEAGEINGDGTIGISDLTFEVDYLFRGGPHPACGLYNLK